MKKRMTLCLTLLLLCFSLLAAPESATLASDGSVAIIAETETAMPDADKLPMDTLGEPLPYPNPGGNRV